MPARFRFCQPGSCRKSGLENSITALNHSAEYCSKGQQPHCDPFLSCKSRSFVLASGQDDPKVD